LFATPSSIPISSLVHVVPFYVSTMPYQVEWRPLFNVIYGLLLIYAPLCVWSSFSHSPLLFHWSLNILSWKRSLFFFFFFFLRIKIRKKINMKACDVEEKTKNNQLWLFVSDSVEARKNISTKALVTQNQSTILSNSGLYVMQDAKHEPQITCG